MTIAILNNELVPPVFGIKITVLVVTYFLAVLIMWLAWQEKKRKAKNKAHKDLQDFLTLVKSKPSLDDLPIKHQIDDYFKEQDENSSPTVKQLCHAWREFSEGVKEYHGEWMNVYQAEEFFKASLLVEPVVKPMSYYATWASSSGLLFTFIALTAGLSELHYGGVGEIKGIGDFINALSGKFITSIIGLGLAVAVFDNQHRKAVEVLTHKLDDIVYELNRAFKRLTSQHILLQIQKDVHQLPQSIDSYFDKLDGESGVIKSIETAISEGIKSQVVEIKDAIGKVPTAISEGLTPPMERLDLNTKAIAETLGTSTQDVSKGISDGINKHLEDLNKTMGALPKTIEALVKAIGEGQGDNVEALLKSFQGEMTRLMGEVARSGGEVNSKMQESLSTLTIIVENLNQTNTATKTQTGEAIEQIQKGANDASNTIKGNLQDVLGELKTVVNAFAETLGTSTQDVSKGISDGINKHLEDLNKTMGALPKTIEALVKAIGEGQGDNVEALLKSFQGEMTRLMGEVARSGGEVNSKMQESLSTLTIIVENLNQTNTATKTQTGEAIEQIQKGANDASNTIKGNLQDVLGELKTAVNAFSKVGKDAPPLLNIAFENFKNLLDNQLTTFVTTQDGLIHKLGTNVNSIANIQEGIQVIEAKLTPLQTELADAYQDHNTLTKEQLDALKQSIADLQSLMSAHQARVGQLHQQYNNMDVLAQNIATTFADSAEKMANNVENIMTKSSKQYLEDFSQKHNNAIASIQTMAENIAEALSDKGIQAVAPQNVNR